MSHAVVLENLTKAYARYSVRRQFATLKSALLRGSILTDLRPDTVFTALKDVSFTVEAGTTTAIIGPNGSGKSTLLKLLAGVTKPSSGTLQVNGRVAALLELGTGFHPEVSGRENIVINGMMLGLPKKAIEAKVPEIIDFAGLEEFIDAPVKTYSSGMYARLAFAVAFAVDPDILLVDEILAVGDEAFAFKCLGRFQDFKRQGKTIIFVTHGMMLAESLADTAVLLERGQLTGIGEPREIVDRYRGHVHASESAALAEAPAPVAATETGEDPASVADAGGDARRWGTGEVKIEEVTLRAKDGQPAGSFHTGETLLVDIEVSAETPQGDLMFGFGIRTRDGRLVYETNTVIEKLNGFEIEGAGRIVVELPNIPLVEGSYLLDVSVHRRIGVALDSRQACRMFAVRNALDELGTTRIEHAWSFTGGLRMVPSKSTT